MNRTLERFVEAKKYRTRVRTASEFRSRHEQCSDHEHDTREGLAGLAWPHEGLSGSGEEQEGFFWAQVRRREVA